MNNLINEIIEYGERFVGKTKRSPDMFSVRIESDLETLLENIKSATNLIDRQILASNILSCVKFTYVDYKYDEDKPLYAGLNALPDEVMDVFIVPVLKGQYEVAKNHLKKCGNSRLLLDLARSWCVQFEKVEGIKFIDDYASKLK